MAIPYPSSPTVGQTFTYGGITYTWNGVAWTYTQTNTPAVVGSVAVTAPITNTGTPTAPVIGINQSALSIAQSQVTNLVSDLAGKANLVGGNSFTDAQVIASSGTASIPLVVRGTAGQSANLTEWQNNAGGTVAFVSSAGLFTPAAIRQTTTGNLNSFGGAAVSGQIVSIFTGGTANKGLVVQGASGQTADTLQIQDNNANVLGRINASGQIGVTRLSVTSNAAVQSASRFFAAASTATDVVAIVRGAASQSASLQEWQNSSGGTVTRITASGSLLFPNSSTSINGDTGNAVIQANSASAVHLVVRGAASQSANLQEWQTSAGGTVAVISSAGTLRLTNITDTAATGSFFRFNAANLQVDTRTSTNTGLIISGVASQTGDLQTWTNAGAGTVFARVSASGQIASGGTAVAGPSFLGQITAIPASTATVGVVVRGASGQSANLQEWQVDGGTVRAFVNNLGRVGIRTSSLLIGSESLAVATVNPTDQGIVVRGVASQSANLQEWQTSAGSTALAVNSAGLINATRAVTVTQTNTGEYYLRLAGVASQTGDFLQVNDSSANPLFRVASTGAVTAGGTARLGQVTVIPASTATVGVVVQGLLNQSADLQQWQTSTGSTAAYLGSGGAFRAAVLQTSSAAVDARLRNAGGEITFAKATAVSTNPGAGYGKIYFRDGTLAGTLRFVSITGASGVEETLIDNISSGTAVASARFTGAGGVNTAGSVISSAGFSLSGTVAPILLNGSAGTSGQVLTSGGAGTTPTWTTVGGGGGSFTGGTLTSDLVLAAGSTAVEPLTFQANTSTVGTVSGAMEYDGTVFYQTSNTNPGKALATQNYYYVSNSDYGPDFTVNSTAKSLLGGSTVGLTVAAGTTYEYELITAISHQFVTTASISGDYLIVSTTVSGSPVVSTTHQVDYGSNTTGFTTATTLSTVRPTGNVTFMPAITSGTRYAFLRAKGLIRVTGTGTVKIYPAIQTSGASGSGDNIWNVRSGTIFKLTPVGNGTVTQVGAFA